MPSNTKARANRHTETSDYAAFLLRAIARLGERIADDPAMLAHVEEISQALTDAVKAVDRISHGRSSRPASEIVETAANVVTAHQIVKGLLDGTIGYYANVISVGHSYGSAVAMEEAAQFADATGSPQRHVHGGTPSSAAGGQNRTGSLPSSA